MLEFLRHRFTLDALSFHVSGEENPASRYPAGLFARHCAIALPRHSKALQAKLFRNMVRAAKGVSPLVDRFAGHEQALGDFVRSYRYDLAWCEHFWVAPYAPLLRQTASRLVLDLHNVESEYFETAAYRAGLSQRWIWQRFREVSAKLEAQLLPQFDLVLVPSADNATRLRGVVKAWVVPNAIPLDAWPQTLPERSLAFSANFAYTPNLEGLAWFATQVWPILNLGDSRLRLRLIGKEAELAQRLFPNPERVEFVGPVVDALEEIAKSKVAVVPLFTGSGTRLKILEAWAAGSAVVSTPLGAAGLDCKAGTHLEIAEQASEFAQSVLDLLDDERRRSRLVLSARALLESRYTWPSAHKVLSELNL